VEFGNEIKIHKAIKPAMNWLQTGA